MDKISVIISCFNASRWLEESIDSILNQTYKNIEVIAINDGSEDTTLDILNKKARKDSRLIILNNKENIGRSASRNRGIKVASGKYIAHMDADDVSLGHRLETQVRFIEETGIDLCGCWFTEYGRGLTRAVRWPCSELAVHTLLLFQNPLINPTLLGKHEVFYEFNYGEDYLYSEDYDLIVRIARDYRVALVPEILQKYRRHGNQFSTHHTEIDKMNNEIRHNALLSQGIKPSCDELRLHNLIRARNSINSERDLAGIQSWLIKLQAAHEKEVAKQIIASQWLRACIRAAPLGKTMWQLYKSSPLIYKTTTLLNDFDMKVLSILKLEHKSPVFEKLRRFGLTA